MANFSQLDSSDPDSTNLDYSVWTEKYKTVITCLTDADQYYRKLRAEIDSLKNENEKLKENVEMSNFFVLESENKRKEMQQGYETLISNKNLQLAKKEQSLQGLIISSEALSESLVELEDKLDESLKVIQTLSEQKQNLLDQLHKKSQRLEVNSNYLKDQIQINKKYEKNLESKLELIDRLELEKKQLEANYEELDKSNSSQMRDLTRKIRNLQEDFDRVSMDNKKLVRDLERASDQLVFVQMNNEELSTDLMQIKMKKCVDKSTQTMRYTLNKPVQTTNNKLKNSSTQTNKSGLKNDLVPSQRSFDAFKPASQLIDEPIKLSSSSSDLPDIDFSDPLKDLAADDNQNEHIYHSITNSGSSSVTIKKLIKSNEISSVPKSSLLDKDLVKEMDDTYYLNKNLLYAKSLDFNELYCSSSQSNFKLNLTRIKDSNKKSCYEANENNLDDSSNSESKSKEKRVRFSTSIENVKDLLN